MTSRELLILDPLLCAQIVSQSSSPESAELPVWRLAPCPWEQNRSTPPFSFCSKAVLPQCLNLTAGGALSRH